MTAMATMIIIMLMMVIMSLIKRTTNLHEKKAYSFNYITFFDAHLSFQSIFSETVLFHAYDCNI